MFMIEQELFSFYAVFLYKTYYFNLNISYSV